LSKCTTGTYKYTNPNQQLFTFKICPSYSEVKFLVKREKLEISNIIFSSVSNLTILSDRLEEKRMMITSENFIMKITLKPVFQIELIEERDV
jgi:hypothetical protein